MRVTTFRRQLLAAAGAALLASQAGATTLTQMNLADMAGRADKIFRGTILSVKGGSVRAGGGELPVVVYRLRVDERFKGEFGESKDAGILEIRMVGEHKSTRQDGMHKFSIWRDVPRLEAGQDYVLFTTRPSRVGLSTTVGLGQGAFLIKSAGKEEQAINAFGNLGLTRGMGGRTSLRDGGPVSYADLAQAIRAVLGR